MSYTLYGYLKISEESSKGFLIPVVTSGGKKYSLEINENNVINDVIELDDVYADYISNDFEGKNYFGGVIRKGEEAFFMYQVNDLLFIGTKEKLIDELTNNFNNFIHALDSFNKYDLFNFLGISAQAEIEKQKIKKEENLLIAEEPFTQISKEKVNGLINIPNLIIEKDSYSQLFNRYPSLHNIFSDHNLNVRIGTNLVNKNDLNHYLETKGVLNSLVNRYSIEIYILMKKQCGGTLELIKELPALKNHTLEATTRVKSLYSSDVEFSLGEEFIPHMLASLIDVNEKNTSPSILNMRFESKFFIQEDIKDEEESFDINPDKEQEIDAIKEMILKNNR